MRCIRYYDLISSISSVTVADVGLPTDSNVIV